jgi:hypothetical protein
MISSFDTTVRGGMPVEVNFEIGQPEPDVGIFTPYVEDVWLEIKGKRAIWLEDRLSSVEWEKLEDEILEVWHESK